LAKLDAFTVHYDAVSDQWKTMLLMLDISDHILKELQVKKMNDLEASLS
jgi:hypothetical protein